jgi:hypothetical protein
LAGAIVAVLHVRRALDATDEPMFTRALLLVCGVSLFFGMTLAACYAVRAYAVPLPWLGLPQMRAFHGTLNAVGVGFCGVLGWRMTEAN